VDVLYEHHVPAVYLYYWQRKAVASNSKSSGFLWISGSRKAKELGRVQRLGRSN
jgi:hypothetical protein